MNHKLGPCTVLVNDYRSDIKGHESRWEPGEIVGLCASIAGEKIPYRVNVRPLTKPGRMYAGCHPDCVVQA